jgi:hypothetical protein
MGSLALLQSLKESILGQASVKTIYGEEAWAIAAPEGKAVVVAEEYELFPWAS